MKRTLVIGDIHGGYRALVQVLKRAQVTAEDMLIFLGDYVDGWSETAQTIQLLIELEQKQPCIFIKGNHDVWCEDWLRTGKAEPSVWLVNGGKETIDSYSAFSDEDKLEHLHFFERMPIYYKDKKNRLFVHAGFTSMHGAEHETFKPNLYFDRTLWEVATILEEVKTHTDYEDTRLGLYREIYIGHTPTIHFDSDIPINAINLWNVDTDAAFTGKLTILDVATKQFWQSDPLPELYPGEKGRN